MDGPALPARDSFSFADLLAPLSPGEFAADIRGKKPVHIQGAPDKFAFAMSWDILNGILNQSAIWTPQTLTLVLDTAVVPADRYAREEAGRDGKPTQLVDFDKVRALVRQGASLVVNGLETLTPGTRRISETLSAEPGGKVAANLYCSWQRHQAFDVHFDTHEVFAMQVTGEKMWRVYQRHFRDPINHPAFKNLDKSYHQANKGPLLMEIMMRPGDVIYIPRGFYHEALAESDASVHMSYSIVPMIGLDVVSVLFEYGVMDELFRAALPHPSVRGGQALDEHLMRMAGRVREMLRDPKIREHLDRLIRDFRYPTQHIKLPDDAGK